MNKKLKYHGNNIKKSLKKCMWNILLTIMYYSLLWNEYNNFKICPHNYIRRRNKIIHFTYMI